MIEVEKIFLQVHAKTITHEQGGKLLWEQIFRNKNKFGLSFMDEDSLQDFLMGFQFSLPRILRQFQIGKGTFFSFLYMKIHLYSKSWVRSSIKKRIGLESCRYGIYSHYDLMQEQYDKEEAFCVAENFNHSIQDFKALVKKLPAVTYRRSTAHRRNPLYSAAKESSIRKETVLLLALKSCRDMTEDIFERTCLLTGIKAESLKKLLDKARESTEHKTKRQQQYIKSRDNAFFFHKRYLLEKNYMDEKCCNSWNIDEKYKRQTRTWETSNKILKSSLCMPTPSTKTVAKLLGMNVRHAEYLLMHIPRNMDKIKLKWYPLEHENISCYRKSE